jgi:iron complex transport system permease protein
MTVAERARPQSAAKTHRFRLKRLSGVSALTILGIILVLLFVLSFALGRYPISPVNVVKILLSHVLPITHTWPDIMDTVVYQIRLPRILAALAIGGGLAVSGASFQGLFRNPLVSPDILGVASGASLGAALGILLSGNRVVIELMAFSLALLAVGIAYTISKIVRGNPILGLILAGMAIGSLFSSFLSLAKYAADTTDQLPAITYWLMGSLAAVTFTDLLFAAVPILLGVAVLLLIRWRLNVLAMAKKRLRRWV